MSAAAGAAGPTLALTPASRAHRTYPGLAGLHFLVLRAVVGAIGVMGGRPLPDTQVGGQQGF